MLYPVHIRHRELGLKIPAVPEGDYHRVKQIGGIQKKFILAVVKSFLHNGLQRKWAASGADLRWRTPYF